MDQNHTELTQLIEQENIVAKVQQLIELKIKFYESNPMSSEIEYVDTLLSLANQVDAQNALNVLELVLDGAFETMNADEIVACIA